MDKNVKNRAIQKSTDFFVQNAREDSFDIVYV